MDLKKLSILILTSLFAVSVISCASSTSVMNDSKKNIMQKSRDENIPVYYKFMNSDKPEISTVEKFSNLYVKFEDSEKMQPIQDLDYITFIKPGMKTEIPVMGRYYASVVEGTISKFVHPVIYFSESESYKITLIDNTTLFGHVNSINLETSTIDFSTKITRLPIDCTKVKEMVKAELRDYVEITLKDGTKRKGHLEKEDGKVVILETVLGNEKYSREKVLKIDYLKKGEDN